MDRLEQREAGMTLLELMLAMAGSIMLMFVVAALFSQTIIFFQSAHARFQMRDEARNSADTMTQFLRSGLAQSVTISRHDPTTDPMYSCIDFDVSNGRGLVSTTHYKFFLKQNLANPDFDLWMKVSTRDPVRMAQNVADLKFFYPDSSNTAVIGVQLVFRKTIGSNVIALYRAVNPVKLLPM